jgi:hypothetical protein
VWYPTDPPQPPLAVGRNLKAGEAVYMDDNRWYINAARIRIWARTTGGTEWQDYRNADLWLVERDGNGLRRYYAEKMDTFTFSFTQ